MPFRISTVHIFEGLLTFKTTPTKKTLHHRGNGARTDTKMAFKPVKKRRKLVKEFEQFKSLFDKE